MSKDEVFLILEVILRSRGIDTLILTGIATSGVVLSTLREAADKDYGLVVLSDACLTEAHHRKKIFQ
jgi:nicotinamidase-related amidase